MDRFQTFVNPGVPLSKKIIELTGIRDDMVQDAPDIRQALEAFDRFAGKSVLCAHNARFDISFIRNAGERFGLPFENGVVDTLSLIHISRFIDPYQWRTAFIQFYALSIGICRICIYRKTLAGF